MKNALFFSLCLSISLVACGDDSGRTTTDTGVQFDITLTDNNVAMDTTVETDTMVATDTGTGTDTGGPTCAVRVPPAPTLPSCAAATLTCAMDCGNDAACQQACFTADENPDCATCVSSQNIICANSMGCDAEYGAVDCCIQDNMCADEACISANCGAEIGAFQTCAQGVGAACSSQVTMCFASE